MEKEYCQAKKVKTTSKDINLETIKKIQIHILLHIEIVSRAGVCPLAHFINTLNLMSCEYESPIL